MLETAIAQLRFALSLALGRPFHTPSLDHLIDAIRETQQEFGPTSIGAEGAEILGGHWALAATSVVYWTGDGINPPESAQPVGYTGVVHAGPAANSTSR